MSAIASVQAILLSVLLGALSSREANARLSAAVDAFAYVGLLGLAAVSTLPRCAAEMGPLALALGALGLVVPALLERVTRRLDVDVRAAAAVVVAGIAACSAGRVDDGAWSALLRWLPPGVACWALVRPAMGARAAWAVAAALVGGAVARHADILVPSPSWMAVEALLCGVVCAAVVRSPSKRASARHRGSTMAGAVAGFVVVLGAGASDAAVWALGAAMLDLARDSAPALLVSFAVVGVLQAALPDPTPQPRVGDAVGPRTPRASAKQAAVGVAVGLPTPLCSCSVVPLYRAMVRRGVAPPTALAFLIAAPEIGVPAIFMSVTFLGVPLTLARTAGAAVLAFTVAAVVGRSVPSSTARPSSPLGAPLRARLALGPLLRRTAVGMSEALDHTGPWIALGLFIGALASPHLDALSSQQLPASLEVVVFSLVGVPLYVCASGSTPIAAVLLSKGVSAGAVLALLWTGPATNVTTIGLLSQLHGRRTAAAFTLLLAAVAIALGVLINTLLPSVTLPPAATGDTPSALNLAALAGLLCAALLSLWRLGPRVVMAQLEMGPIHERTVCPVHGPGCSGPAAPPTDLTAAVASLSFSSAPPKPRIRLAPPR